jgi:hypothetical protein
MRYEIVRPPEYFISRQFKPPWEQSKEPDEPGKPTRKVAVNAVVGAYGGFYQLD